MSELAFLASLLCLVQLLQLSAAVTPGQAYDLSGWELDTCLKHPSVVKGATLDTYTDANFFLGDNGTIVMLTPDNATGVTANADHPRTEFRDRAVADWELTSGEHLLSLETAVIRVSNTTGETILAQIHGSVVEELAKVLKLRWTRGLVEARVKNHTAPYEEYGLGCGTYALGEKLVIQVHMSAGVLHVTVNGNTVSYKPPFNPADRFYFKAGDYPQCKPCKYAGQYSEVHLSQLNVTDRKSVV